MADFNSFFYTKLRAYDQLVSFLHLLNNFLLHLSDLFGDTVAVPVFWLFYLVEVAEFHIYSLFDLWMLTLMLLLLQFLLYDYYEAVVVFWIVYIFISFSKKNRMGHNKRSKLILADIFASFAYSEGKVRSVYLPLLRNCLDAAHQSHYFLDACDLIVDLDVKA